MMATILNSSILNSAFLDSAILHKTLTQTNSIWLKLIHSDSTWRWQLSWILPCWIQTLPSWIQTPCYLLSDSLKNTLHSILTLTQTNSIWLKLIHSEWMWWWQPSWNLPSWIQTPCYLLSDWIHTLLDQTNSIDSNFTQKHSHSISDSNSLTLRLEFSICTQPWLIHSHSTWWWQQSWILPCWIQTLPSFRHLVIFSQIHSKITLTPFKIWLPLFQSKKPWLIHSDSTVMMAAILNSAKLDSDTAILDSDTLLSSLRFTQKHSHSTLTLTQTNSIWLKLIHSHSTWWWQQSWILPICIQLS